MVAPYQMLDGNEAVANVAYALNEVIAIYPITPLLRWANLPISGPVEKRSKSMGRCVPSVVKCRVKEELQGAVHGALQRPCLNHKRSPASQGLLLMIPNMYKIAESLTPLVIHVASRALAAQGLSIFGDHSDVMACRATGFAMLSAANVQEAADIASLISQALH